MRPARRGAALAALLLLGAMRPVAAETPDLARGLNLEIWVEWLAVDDMLTREGFLTPYPDWRRFVGKEEFERYRADGFDFLRMPFDPGPMLALGPGPAQDALIAEIRAAAEMGHEAGLTVIVDLHSIPRPDEVWGTDDVMGRMWPDYLPLVGRVAAALDGLPPERTLFEPLNEPTLDCDAIWDDSAEAPPERWPDMLAQMHAVARAGAPDLPLVLSGACWGGIDGLERVDPGRIGDENVIWSYHSYDPFPFTHQSANWTGSPLKYISRLPYPPSSLDDVTAMERAAAAALRMQAAEGAADPAAIAAEIAAYRAMPDDIGPAVSARAAEWAARHGIPARRLILGEFGAIHTDQEGRFQGDDALRYIADQRAGAEQQGIAWAVWSLTGEMAVTLPDDPARVMDPAVCAALGLAGCAP